MIDPRAGTARAGLGQLRPVCGCRQSGSRAGARSGLRGPDPVLGVDFLAPRERGCPCGAYSMRRPEMAREITSCWICSVPSKKCRRSGSTARPCINPLWEDQHPAAPAVGRTEPPLNPGRFDAIARVGVARPGRLGDMRCDGAVEWHDLERALRFVEKEEDGLSLRTAQRVLAFSTV